MQISVTGRHMEFTEAIKNHAREKVASAFAPFPRVQHVRVILDVEKYRQRAEVVVQATNHIHIEAEDESEDMYASIDAAVEKAERQLRRRRDKVQHHKGRESISEVDQALDAESTGAS